MKKFFTLILSLVLILGVSLGGCSCSPTNYLVFTNNFMGGDDVSPSVGYKETITYTAQYVSDDGKYPSLAKSSSTDSVIEASGISYSGTYVTTFEALSPSQVVLPDGVSSDLLSEQTRTEKNINQVYSFKTAMNLTATYNFKDKTEPTVVQDKIETSVYFLQKDNSFAPIYSTYCSDVNIFSLSSPTHLVRAIYDYKTVYNEDEFIMNTYAKQIVIDSDGKEIIDEVTDNVEKGYTFRTDIDNNSLLFALRNFKTDEESTSKISVISPAYKDYEYLSLSKHTVEQMDVTINGESKKLPVKKFSFCVDDQYASGQNQFVTIQTGASTDNTIANKALLVSFAQPLFDYSSISCMGALEFTLSSIA